MADGYAASNIDRKARVSVDDHAILNVACRADADSCDVAAKDRAEPHRCFLVELYGADEDRIRRDEAFRADRRRGALKGQNHFQAPAEAEVASSAPQRNASVAAVSTLPAGERTTPYRE